MEGEPQSFDDELVTQLNPASIREAVLPSIYTAERQLNPNFPPIHLEHGEIPFDPPSELDVILEEYHQSGKLKEDLLHLKTADMSEGIENIRKLYGLKNAQIIFNPEGSDAILYNITGMVPVPPAVSRVAMIGPCFPNFENFIKQRFGSAYDEDHRVQVMKIQDTLTRKADYALERAISFQKDRHRRGFKPLMYYLCNPTTPTGDKYSMEILEEFISVCEEGDATVAADCAFALGSAASVSPLCEKYNNLIVTETLNKKLLGGLGVGFTVMSPNIERAYKSARRPMDMREKMQLYITNKLTNPNILIPYLEQVDDKTREIKADLRSKLWARNVRILPTASDTVIFTVDGENEGFYDATAEVGLGVVPCESFKNTHTEMSNRYVRVTIPGNKDDNAEIAERLLMAKELANAA